MLKPIALRGFYLQQTKTIMNKKERRVPEDDERLSKAELIIYGIMLLAAFLMMLSATISYIKFVVL